MEMERLPDEIRDYFERALREEGVKMQEDEETYDTAADMADIISAHSGICVSRQWCLDAFSEARKNTRMQRQSPKDYASPTRCSDATNVTNARNKTQQEIDKVVREVLESLRLSCSSEQPFFRDYVLHEFANSRDISACASFLMNAPDARNALLHAATQWHSRVEEERRRKKEMRDAVLARGYDLQQVTLVPVMSSRHNNKKKQQQLFPRNNLTDDTRTKNRVAIRYLDGRAVAFKGEKEIYLKNDGQ